MLLQLQVYRGLERTETDHWKTSRRKGHPFQSLVCPHSYFMHFKHSRKPSFYIRPKKKTYRPYYFNMQDRTFPTLYIFQSKPSRRVSRLCSFPLLNCKKGNVLNCRSCSRHPKQFREQELTKAGSIWARSSF